jgi:hypothetical protein
MGAEGKEKENKKIDLQELHHVTHQKISFAKRKKSLSEREVYLIAKEFFQDLLKLNYEFTHDELIEELRKTYLDKESFAKLESFILLLGQMEYSKKEFTQEELKVMLEEMKVIVDKLIHHHHKKKTIVEKIITLLYPQRKKEFDFETSALEKLEEKIIKEEEVIDKKIIKEMETLIEKATTQPTRERAKEMYEDIKQLYDSLDKKEQKHIHPQLVKAAEAIKSLPGHQEQKQSTTTTNENIKSSPVATPKTIKTKQHKKEVNKKEDAKQATQPANLKIDKTIQETLNKKEEERKEKTIEHLSQEIKPVQEKTTPWTTDQEEQFMTTKEKESDFAKDQEESLFRSSKETTS